MSRILLIVDDEPDLAPLFSRFLRRDFDEVHFAVSAADAEAILSRAVVTHLVVDNTLGRGETTGPDLIVDWRSKHPSIEFAALFSGSTLFSANPRPDRIDEIFVKPTGFEPLLSRLRQR